MPITSRQFVCLLACLGMLVSASALGQEQDTGQAETTVDTAPGDTDAAAADTAEDTAQDDGTHPGNMKVELDVVRIGIDAGGGDDFEIGRGLQANYIYSWKPWLGLEAGLYATEDVQDQTRQDVVGQYRVTLNTRSLQLGVRPQYMFTQWRVYGRLGLLAYQTQLEVEEFFDDAFPGGRESASDDGTGIYFGLGATYFVTRSITVQFEYLHMQQNGVFEGRSDQAFDLKLNNLGIGIGYVF